MSTTAPETTPAPYVPVVGDLVSFNAVDEITGQNRNGHALVRAVLEDGRAVLTPLPTDTIVADDTQIAKA